MGGDHVKRGFPGGISGKEPACQCKRLKKMRVRSPSWEDPLEEGMSPTPGLLPGESRGQRSLAGYTVHRVAELDMNEST